MKQSSPFKVIFVALVLKNNSAPIKCTLSLSGLPTRVEIYSGFVKLS